MSDRVFEKMPDGPQRYLSAKPLARFVPSLTKSAFQKYGFSSAALIADWYNIVGNPLAERCVPERVNWPRKRGAAAHPSSTTNGAGGATLILRTDAAFALEIDYASAQILERINAYFGYLAITTLKIVQGPRPPVRSGRTNASDNAPRQPPNLEGQRAPDHANASEGAIAAVDDDALKAALARLHRSILADA